MQLHYIYSVCIFPVSFVPQAGPLYIPIVLNRLDDKTECRTDAVYIFVHDLLHYSRLSCIVKTTDAVSFWFEKQS